jgi:peptide deformylase
MYQKPAGAIETRQLVGLAAIVFQHEVDHLEGLLLSDVGLEIDSDFENATEEE